MINKVRKWWYNNETGGFNVRDKTVTKRMVQTYGGPSPDYNNCEICQFSEWLSRIDQHNTFQPHNCPTAKACADVCAKQGNDLWTNYHQDFRFSIGVDPSLDAPKGAVIFLNEPSAELWQVWNGRRCEQLMPRLRRQFAQACQIDVYSHMNVDWSKYDFCFFQNTGKYLPMVERPSIPIIMYCHDPWGDYQQVSDDMQTRLNHYRPSYLLTPYPSIWKTLYFIPNETTIRFYPQPEGTFFARPNLGAKKLDLLVIGTATMHHYTPRRELMTQVEPLKRQFKIEFSTNFGSNSWMHSGPVEYTGKEGLTRYLNKWSEYLGTAKYVTFGPCAGAAKEMLLMKYYECLGSGAIPIMPEVEDLKLLGVQPMIHYIPLSNVWQNNTKLEHYLRCHQDYHYIAENAVQWYQDNADTMLYTRFEDLIQEAISILGGYCNEFLHNAQEFVL